MITLVEMRRSSFISIDTGNGNDQSDEESDEPSGGGRWPVQQLAAGRTAFLMDARG